MKSNHFNDIWDEHQWESHINQIEEKNHHFRDFLDNTFGEESPRWYRILKESPSEHDALDSFIEEQLMFDDAYFPDDDDDWDTDDDLDDDLIFGMFEDPFDEFEDDFDDLDDEWELDDDLLDDSDDWEDIEEGEEWKLLSEDYAMTNDGAIENLGIYNDAHRLGIRILRMAEEREQLHLNKFYNQFVSDILQISTKIAAGYSLGFELDVMGGNIAYTKKALQAANRALTSLQGLKNKSVFPKREDYFVMHTEVFEVRNNLGIYIQDLRERFYSRL